MNPEITYNYIDPVPPPYPRKNKVKYRPLPPECNPEQPSELPPNSGKIELTRGLFAIVDSDMVENLNRFSWSAAPDYRTVYATTRDTNKQNVRMHRHILRIPNDVKVQIDHINGNGLDNRRENLRVVSAEVNQLNRRPRTKLKNRFKGVVRGNVQGFTVWFMLDGTKYKKNFDNEVEAAIYYDSLVVRHRGGGSKTNLSLGRFTKKEITEYSYLFSKNYDDYEPLYTSEAQEETSSSLQTKLFKLYEKRNSAVSQLNKINEKIKYIEKELDALRTAENSS